MNFEILVFLGVVFGIILSGCTICLFSIILGELMGLTLIRIGGIFREGFRYEKGEKFKWNKKKFGLFPEVVYNGKNITKKQDAILGFVPLFISIVIYAVFLTLICIKYKERMLDGGIGILTGISGGALSFLVVMLIIFIGELSNPINRELRRLFNLQIAELRNGASFRQLQVYPALANNVKASKNVRIIQWNICIEKAMFLGDYQVLPIYLKNMDDLLKTENGYSDFYAYTGCYYNLLFYSSFVCLNAPNATKIYNVIKERLEADMDPNGRRVLAAYQLMILNRPDLAAVTLYQAEEAFYHLPKVYTEAEVELDKKFIAELKNRLNIMSNPVQENSPVMSYRPDSYR